MRLQYQNLQEPNEPRRFWSYGRAWLHRGGEWYDKRCGTLGIEWTVPMGHCGWALQFGKGDSARDVGVTVAVPFLCTLYMTLANVLPLYPFGTDFDRGRDREISLAFH